MFRDISTLYSYSCTYLAVRIEQLAAVTPNDSERVPPVRALHVGVKLILRQRNARRLRSLVRSRRSRHHRNALPDNMCRVAGTATVHGVHECVDEAYMYSGDLQACEDSSSTIRHPQSGQRTCTSRCRVDAHKGKPAKPESVNYGYTSIIDRCLHHLRV